MSTPRQWVLMNSGIHQPLARDFEEVQVHGEPHVIVWKFPGDMFAIGNGHLWLLENIRLPLPVGNYPFRNDCWGKLNEMSHSAMPLNSQVVKMRVNHLGPTSIHYLQGASGAMVVMLGYQYFVPDMWQATPSTKTTVGSMLDKFHNLGKNR